MTQETQMMINQLVIKDRQLRDQLGELENQELKIYLFRNYDVYPNSKEYERTVLEIFYKTMISHILQLVKCIQLYKKYKNSYKKTQLYLDEKFCYL